MSLRIGAGSNPGRCKIFSSCVTRRAGSDGSMSASGSAGPGFDPRRGSKFSFENFQSRG